MSSLLCLVCVKWKQEAVSLSLAWTNHTHFKGDVQPTVVLMRHGAPAERRSSSCFSQSCCAHFFCVLHQWESPLSTFFFLLFHVTPRFVQRPYVNGRCLHKGSTSFWAFLSLRIEVCKAQKLPSILTGFGLWSIRSEKVVRSWHKYVSWWSAAAGISN